MYDVTDVLGRVMQRGILKDALSIEELPSGNYFLCIWEAGQAVSVKHIVKR
jgi:hypothetical protein